MGYSDTYRLRAKTFIIIQRKRLNHYLSKTCTKRSYLLITTGSFQSRKRLYINKCPFVRLSVSHRNLSTAWNHHPSSFFIHPPSFYLHFATFKLFSLFNEEFKVSGPKSIQNPVSNADLEPICLAIAANLIM